MPSARDYPELEQLLGGYFQQDFDIVAEDDEGLIHQYLKDATPEQKSALIEDIERFLANHPTGAYAAFEDYFSPQAMFYEPSDSGVLEWLEAVLDLLNEATL